MFANQSLLSSSPIKAVEAGAILLRRSVMADTVIYIESGRAGLGVLDAAPASSSKGGVLEHQLRVAVGPCWLEATAAVLDLPSAVDAVAETDLTVRRIPLAEFKKGLKSCGEDFRSMLLDMAAAHRQQTESVVSRLAKDAEARCAEWLLRHAQNSDVGVCSVQLQLRKRMIATQLGIAPETLSRVLRHLRERSLISGTGRVVNLVDLPGLRSLAGA